MGLEQQSQAYGIGLTEVSAAVSVLIAIPTPLKLATCYLNLLPTWIAWVNQGLVVLIVESVFISGPVRDISRVL